MRFSVITSSSGLPYRFGLWLTQIPCGINQPLQGKIVRLNNIWLPRGQFPLERWICDLPEKLPLELLYFVAFRTSFSFWKSGQSQKAFLTFTVGSFQKYIDYAYDHKRYFLTYFKWINLMKVKLCQKVSCWRIGGKRFRLIKVTLNIQLVKLQRIL